MSDDVFKGEVPFKVVNRIEAFMLFAVSFFHSPTFPLTEEQINQAGRALTKCDKSMDNWVEGDAEDPITGWHPCTRLAAEMFEIAEDKLNTPQKAYAKLIYYRFKGTK